MCEQSELLHLLFWASPLLRLLVLSFDLPLDLTVQALQELILLADHLQHLVELLVCLLCFIASADLLVSLVERATIWILAGLLRVRWIRLMRRICIVELIRLERSGLILLGVGGVSILEAIQFLRFLAW